jgi:hypothetical protein
VVFFFFCGDSETEKSKEDWEFLEKIRKSERSLGKMKIQCNVCEAAEANVLCCADEAALCWTCDEKVHAANKLASKHQRIPLSTSSPQMPKCDICQVIILFFHVFSLFLT